MRTLIEALRRRLAARREARETARTIAWWNAEAVNGPREMARAR